MTKQEMAQKMAEKLPSLGFSRQSKGYWYKDNGIVRWDVYAPFGENFFFVSVKIVADGIQDKVYALNEVLEQCLEEADKSLKIRVERIKATAIALESAIKNNVDYSAVQEVIKECD